MLRPHIGEPSLAVAVGRSEAACDRPDDVRPVCPACCTGEEPLGRVVSPCR